MSDEPLVDYRQTEEPGQASPEPPVDKQEYVTLATLREELAKNAEETRRIVQSLTDKQESRVNSKLTKWAEAYEKASGSKAPQELLSRKNLEFASAEADRAIGDERQPTPSLPPGLDPAKFEQDKARIHARIAELENELGVKMDDDSERMVNWDFSNPADNVIAQAEKALRYKAWEAGQGSPKIAPNAGRMPAPGGAPGAGMLEAFTDELSALQDKRGRTRDDEKRMKELEVEILKHVPRG
jgi:hypothetical protein